MLSRTGKPAADPGRFRTLRMWTEFEGNTEAGRKPNTVVLNPDYPLKPTKCI